MIFFVNLDIKNYDRFCYSFFLSLFFRLRFYSRCFSFFSRRSIIKQIITIIFLLLFFFIFLSIFLLFIFLFLFTLFSWLSLFIFFTLFASLFGFSLFLCFPFQELLIRLLTKLFRLDFFHLCSNSFIPFNYISYFFSLLLSIYCLNSWTNSGSYGNICKAEFITH